MRRASVVLAALTIFAVTPGAAAAARPAVEKVQLYLQKTVRGHEHVLELNLYPLKGMAVVDTVIDSGAALGKLGTDLEATKAHAECAALRKQMGEGAAALAPLTTKLGHEGNVNGEEFSAMVAVQETRLQRYGGDLTKITYRPHC